MSAFVLQSNSVSAQSNWDFHYLSMATTVGDCHQLTRSFSNRRGAIWEKNVMIDLTQDFEMKASAYFGRHSGGGDGIAFVLHNAGPTPLGGIDGAMGFAANPPYNAINQSLAIEFDTRDHGASRGDGGNGNDHIAFVANGDQASPLKPIVDAHVSGQSIQDDEYHEISVTWNATTKTLRVCLDGTLRNTITQDFASTIFNSTNVYWGFTASTGSGASEHVLCNISLCEGSPEFQASIGHLESGVPMDGEEALSVKPANECGFIAVGQNSPSTTYGNMMVVKTDNDGNADWVNTYSLPNLIYVDQGRLTDIEALGDGYIATGWTRAFVRSAIVLRLENDGSVRWASIQAGSHIWDEGYDIEPTPDGGFVLVGSRQGRVFMIHLDANGVQTWSKSYGVENEVWKGYSVEPVAKDGDGVKDDGFVICGAKTTQGDPTWDWLMITTDNAGVVQSAESMGIWGQNDEAFSIKQVDHNGDGVLDDNQFVVGGYISDAIGPNPSRKIAAFAHYSPSGLNGNPTPVVILDDGINESRINALEQNLNGDIVCAGYLAEAVGSPLRDGFFVHSTLNGLYSWSKVFGTTGADDWFNSVEEVKGLGYVLAGGTESFGSGDGDFYVVKIDEWGSSPCNTLQRAYGAGPIEMYSYVHSPQTEDFGGLTPRDVVAIVETPDVDYCTITNKKQSGTTSVNRPEDQSISIYPNPVSNGSSLRIAMDETLTGSAEVVLTDITGKTQLLKKYALGQGVSELSLPINNLSPGMYHISVRTEQRTSVYKVLIE